MKIYSTHTKTAAKKALQAFSGNGIGVGKTKTSIASIDPLEADLRCENEVHCSNMNAVFSTRTAFMHLGNGFGSVFQSCAVAFIVTLFKPFLN